MARIRSVKPELRTSLTAAEWRREIRYFWVLLWGYLDDYGRGNDDVRLIVADCFPLDRDVTERTVDKWLNIIAATKGSDEDEPPLCRYETAGRHYIHAVNWGNHQKISHPTRSRIPPCPVHEGHANPSGGVPEPLRYPQPPVPGGAPEDPKASRARADQGIKGTREQGNKGTVVEVVDPPQVRTTRAPDDEDLDRKPRTAPEAIAVRLGCDDDTAERIAAEVQRRHAPKHPVAYIGRMSDVDLGEVRHSLRNGRTAEPQSATPTPPAIGELCRHGMLPPCPVCAEETPA